MPAGKKIKSRKLISNKTIEEIFRKTPRNDPDEKKTAKEPDRPKNTGAPNAGEPEHLKYPLYLAFHL